MTGRRLRARRALSLALLAVLVVGSLVGCGQGSSQRTPALGRLPLVKGARISVQVLRCDKGANAFCAWELVVVAPRFRGSDALLLSEHALLRKRGWSGAGADVADEHAADSPGHKLRVTYATDYGDLKAIDLVWTQRSRKVTIALSRAIFGHVPTMSMLLEQGAS
ncbi:MAG TPA: hypothetical protein VIM18_09645 [Solirubrobacteraceae bacterium]|jgi:hypothetical protein